MDELVDRSLLDLVETIVDNRGRTCPTATEGTPLIATNCLKDGKRDVVYENIRFVDEDTYANWFRGHPEPGDVLFVCKGSPGRVAVVPDPVPYCIAQDMVALRANSTTDPGYLYYRLRSPDVQFGIQNMHVGTMIPHFKKGDFGRLIFPVHSSLAAQHAIAQVLGALDDKIAANERLVDLADQYLATVFARLAANSPSGVLSMIADVNRAVVKPSLGGALRYVDISAVAQGTYEFPEPITWQSAPGRARRALAYGDTVWSTVRPNRRSHALVLDSDPVLVASTGLAVLTPQAGRIAGLYEATRRSEFTHYLGSVAEGSAYPAVNADRFRDAPIPALSEEAWNEFEQEALPLRQRAHTAVVETRALRRSRDELLPLLMSGRITVKAAEHIVGEVT